jgi:glycosyltransferase involved in cell wall biosynthesis
MRIAFYSPIAKPSDTTPSGISRVGALLVQALQVAGHTVDTPPLPRSYEGKGDAARQSHIYSECENAATNYLEAIALGREPRPDLWFSYHVYYKSPDWIGPRVAKALGVPYLIAEGSHAPKRAKGPWALGHDGTTKALQAADRLLAMTSFDRVCLEWIDKDRVRDLKPFIDADGFAFITHRETQRLRLLAVAMMRNERKLASYRLLATALGMVKTPVSVSIAGAGIHRPDVERAFSAASQHKVKFLGAVQREDLPSLLQEADVFTWPGLGEAYGLAFLEAQAAALPVVACHDRGVPDVVKAEITALLSPPDNARIYARNIETLQQDETMRLAMGILAQRFVTQERSIRPASANLRNIVREVAAA